MPARDLTAADLAELFDRLSPTFKEVYRQTLNDAAALRAWLIKSGIFAEPESEG